MVRALVVGAFLVSACAPRTPSRAPSPPSASRAAPPVAEFELAPIPDVPAAEARVGPAATS